MLQLSRKEGLRVKFKRLTRQHQQQLNVSLIIKKKHKYLGKKISHLKSFSSFLLYHIRFPTNSLNNAQEIL